MFGGGNNSTSGKGYAQVSTHNYSDSDDSSTEGDDFVQKQIRNQKLQMKQQDEGLEMLSQSADRLGQLSLGIHEELGNQNKMLSEMEDNLDHATTRLNFVTNKTKELIQKSGGKRNCLLIVGLSLVVVILIMLIIYY
uniref:t-SNARE coiled-coil homology domain-containing protein n=1 Tax=Eucampia antarctica TaxID=49252 RepID=A0A6U0R1J2_9STRA|mmetsp:Transcript_185/g.192  ORF Transcript_185/g.192 Transcript_185/m.192 type:complete len:137 (+) Transcript_185:261-671(+)